MPEISRFYGIVIEMRRNEHLPPHFHARCGRDVISVTLDGTIVIGHFPPRKLALVQRWRNLHLAELIENWHLARQQKPPRYIDPLD